MIRTLEYTVALLLAFAAPAAAMQKGTVKFFNDSKGFGRAGIVVIEPGKSVELSPGQTVVISGKSVANLAVGDIVSFDPMCDLGCGTEPANLKVIGKAALVEADKRAAVDLTVGPGEVLMLHKGGSIRGNILINSGSLIIVDGTSFDGAIESRDGSFVLVDSGTTLGGKLDSRDGAALILRDVEITGHVHSKGDGYVLLQRSSHHYLGSVTIVK